MAEAHAIHPDSTPTEWADSRSDFRLDENTAGTIEPPATYYWLIADFFARKSKIVILAILTYAALC